MPKWVGIRTKEARAKLTDQESLPFVDEARDEIARTIMDRLGALQSQHSAAIETRLSEIEHKRRLMAEQHAAERKALQDVQQTRWQTETLQPSVQISERATGLVRPPGRAAPPHQETQ